MIVLCMRGAIVGVAGVAGAPLGLLSRWLLKLLQMRSVPGLLLQMLSQKELGLPPLDLLRRLLSPREPGLPQVQKKQLIRISFSSQLS